MRQVQQELSAVQDEREAVQQTVKKLETQLSSKETTVEQLSREIRQASDQRVQLEQMLSEARETAEADATTAEDALKAKDVLDRECTALKRRLSYSASKIQALERMRADLQASWSKARAGMRASVTEANLEARKARSELLVSQQTVQDLHARLQGVHQQVMRFSAATEKHCSRVEQLQRRMGAKHKDSTQAAESSAQGPETSLLAQTQAFFAGMFGDAAQSSSAGGDQEPPTSASAPVQAEESSGDGGDESGSCFVHVTSFNCKSHSSR